MDAPKTQHDTDKLVQASLQGFITLYKTEEERLQAIVDKLNAPGTALPCYVWKGQIVTDLD